MRKLIIFFGKLFFLFKNKNIPKEPRKILIMRSGGIGDVLMSTPLVKAIRRHYPKAKITYFVGNWSKNVLEDNPNIDNIFNYDDMIIIGKNIFGIAGLIQKIRKNRFDLIFNLEKSWHWGLLSYLFGIKARVGFDRKGEGFANTIAVPFNGSKYELEYYLDLARLSNMKITSDDMELYITKKEKSIAQKFIENLRFSRLNSKNLIIKKNKLKNKKILGIAPGGADNPAQQATIKRWPLDNYVELIDKLPKNIEVILFGGKNDIDTCKEIEEKVKNKSRIINTTGKLTIKESAALMKHCKLFLTHDAGPMHMAGAVKVPLIALFGPTQAIRFAPKDAIVIKAKSKPCYDIYGKFKGKSNMGKIKVENVLNKIKQIIK